MVTFSYELLIELWPSFAQGDSYVLIMSAQNAVVKAPISYWIKPPKSLFSCGIGRMNATWENVAQIFYVNVTIPFENFHTDVNR